MSRMVISDYSLQQRRGGPHTGAPKARYMKHVAGKRTLSPSRGVV